jgi:hypothetical protein
MAGPDGREGTAMNMIQEHFASLSIGAPIVHRNLAAWPLMRPDAPLPDYLVLDEALASGVSRVTEVSEGGSVPELWFENASPRRVLLLDGEELVGARQNRVLNITILVGAGQKLVIPVSCVEQGRWSWKIRDFESSKRAMYAGGRARKMAQVSRSLRVANARHADQGAVWDDVADKAAEFAVRSETGAMADVYESAGERLGEFTRRFGPRPGQVGAVFAIDGRVTGMELFDSAETWEKLGGKLAESYAMDALGSRVPAERRPSERQVAEFIIRVQSAPVERFDSLAEGADLRLSGAGVVGGALEADGRIVQLSAFHTGGADTGCHGRTGARIVSMARRRAHRDRS